MPNHVTNVFAVHGPQGALRAFIDRHIYEKSGPASVVTGIVPAPVITLDFESVVVPPAALGDASSVATEGALALVIAALNNDNQFTAQSYGLMHHGGVPDPRNRLRRKSSAPAPTKHAIEWTPGAGHDLIRVMDKQHGADWRAEAHAFLRSIVECEGHGSWYSWNVAKWGTKWNSYDFKWRDAAGPESLTGDDDEPGVITAQFDTAWSVPEPIFKALAEQYPTLQFHVSAFDEGWNFCAEGWFGASLGELMPTFEHYKVKRGDGRAERLHVTCYGYPMEKED